MAGEAGGGEEREERGQRLILLSDLRAGLKAATTAISKENTASATDDAEILRFALLPGREGCLAARR